MEQLFLSNIFSSLEQQYAFVQLVNLSNTFQYDIEKIFLLTNISIENIFEIAIKLNLKILYDYGIEKHLKINSDYIILILCIENSNYDILSLAKNYFKYDFDLIYSKAIELNSINIIEKILDNTGPLPITITINHLILILNIVNDSNNMLYKNIISSLIYKINWSNVPNGTHIINLFVSSGLFEFVKILCEFQIRPDEFTLIESIRKNNIYICEYLLSRGIKLNKTLTLCYYSTSSNPNSYSNIFNLLKSFNYSIDDMTDNLCVINFNK